MCPFGCGYIAVPCHRVQEQPAHTYPCWGDCDGFYKGFCCCASWCPAHGSLQLSNGRHLMLSKNTFSSPLEPQEWFLSNSSLIHLFLRNKKPFAGWPLIKRPTAGRSFRPLHTTHVPQAMLSEAIPCRCHWILKTRNNMGIFGTACTLPLLHTGLCANHTFTLK